MTNAISKLKEMRLAAGSSFLEIFLHSVRILHVWSMHRSKWMYYCMHEVKDLMFVSQHAQTARVLQQQTTTSHCYHWCGSCLYWKSTWRDRFGLTGDWTHFFLVFFALPLFFLAWRARTVRRNQWAFIKLMSSYRLMSIWHSRQKGCQCVRAQHSQPTPKKQLYITLGCIM